MLKFATFLEATSLEYHDTLNPALFDLNTGLLQAEVRSALIRFALAWAAYATIPESLIQDVYFTGGNANFNYTSASDIDCHVVLDKRGLGIPALYLDDFLQDKKALWQARHRATVRGYPLEPFAQDDGERFPLSQGVYSLYRDCWVVEPVHGEYDFTNDPVLDRKIADLSFEIDRAVNHHGSPESVKALLDKLWRMRSAGLERAGEFSVENLAYKELRNLGLIDKLKAYELSATDYSLSLE